MREWNFQASTAQICALGLRRARAGEAGATINGVLFPAPDDLAAFDARENGYMRVEVARTHVELLSWHVLPARARVFVYVPYAPAVVAKYGTDPATGCGARAPSCRPGSPAGAGLGLVGPSVEFPILQSYVDVCISGCLEHGEAFAREFIRTTFPERVLAQRRELARRPAPPAQYVKTTPRARGAGGRHRKLESSTPSTSRTDPLVRVFGSSTAR